MVVWMEVEGRGVTVTRDTFRVTGEREGVEDA